MTPEPTEEQVEAFDRLVCKAADLRAYTWCVRDGWIVWTRSLRGCVCLRCEHHVRNCGICDPL